MRFWRKRKTVIPYHHDLKTPLLALGKRDQFKLDDATRGVLVLGGTGSGKTSGSGKSLAKAYLSAGFGGVVLCAKVEEAPTWRAYLKELGREADLIEIGEASDKRLNFLDYALAVLARPGFEQNLLAVMDVIIDAAKDGGGRGGGDNQYFYDNAREMVWHVLPILIAVYGRLRMQDIVAFIDSAPISQKQLEDKAWQIESYCAKTLALASLVLVEHPDLETHAEYWVSRFASLSDKTRSSIVTTFTSTVYPFLTGKLNELFCTHTNVVPEMTHEGAILLVNLPIKQFGKTGEIAQKIIKYLWQVATEARQPPRKGGMRPVFLFADECQFFVTPDRDAGFLSTARSASACTIYMTQDLPTFHSRLAGEAGENDALSLIGKFQTVIMHTQLDGKTNQYAAELVGQITREQAARQRSHGQNTGAGGAQHAVDSSLSDNSGRNVGYSESITTYRDYAVPPEYFTNQLRNGTKDNRYKVDGIIVTAGRTWRHSKGNFIKAEFDQRE